MAKKTVLAIGIDPGFADLAAFPQLTPELVRSYIDAQIERLRELGFEVDSCLIDLGETAEAVATMALKSRHFNCIVIGAGLRQPPAGTAFAAVRKDCQPRPQLGPGRENLLQHHPGRHRRIRAALDRTLSAP
jgi:ribosomal protein S12 methylthiotransferase accessory factor YcaO